MASPAACRDSPNVPPRDQEPLEPHHPEPACQEAQKWIEAVTGKSFGDKDFRSALENGILLCELLSAIKPGLVKKINRLPTPIAGLDNLSVFLRGCEELGLKGAQLFDPGDLQDTSIRANLKDSDCNRKLKNVLNTVYWLGKAASGCASYSGPTLNLKEFEGLLAQMKLESEEGGDSSQKRSVRDSGYDCWDSERSESLSPPRHTRDNSLDSLDSFGSRSQHSPSPDVVNRGNSDGRGSDSEADAPNRKPDVRKDDMLARRTSSSESRSSIPFNQFLPNRTNVTSYIPTPRRKPHTEDREQRSQVVGDPNQTTPPSADLPPWTTKAAPTPAEIDARLAQYEGRTEEEEEEEGEERVPDLQKDDMMARRTGVFHKQSTATVTYSRFLPLPASKRCTQGDITTDAAPQDKKEVQAERSKKLNVRVEHQQPMETPQQQVETTVIRSVSHSEREYGDNEDEYDENVPVPDLEKDDMMARRTASFQKASAAKTNQFLPVPGSVKYNISPVSAMKALHSRPKLTEKQDSESIVAVAAEPQSPPSKAPTSPVCSGLRERREEEEEREKGDGLWLLPNTSVTAEPLSSPSLTPSPSPATSQICRVEAELEKQKLEERVEEKAEVLEKKKAVNEKPQKKPFWLDDDELPPMIFRMSRRVAFMSEDTESVSMGDMLNEEEVGHLPLLSQSRHERMHEQYNSFLEEEDHWQDDLARWKNRRRSASQDLIRKEEERKRIEKRMKEQGSDGNKRKSIKTYKEIVEEKERREAELCEAYRNAASPEEAALVLQRYALRFTISDAVLDSLKLPRSTSKPEEDLNEVDKEHKQTSPVNNSEMSDHLHLPISPVITNQEHTKPEETETDTADQQEKSATSPPTPASTSSPLSTVTDSQSVSPQSLELNEPQVQLTESPTVQQTAITADAEPQTKHSSSQSAQGQPHPTQPAHTLPSPPSVSTRPVPLLAAKPYCQPRTALSGHKPIKDGLVRVNGVATEELAVSTPPTSSQHSSQDTKDVSSKEADKDAPPVETVKNAETAEQQPPPPPQPEKSAPSSGSAISSLIGGRNCVITTTIVTELTQTVVEPLHPDIQNTGEVGTTGLFGKPEDEKIAEPSSTPSSMEEYSPTVSEGLEESSVTEQYQREQEKLMKEWEKAQLEVEEEERKHNEEERRILEETVTPLNPTGLLNQLSGQAVTTSLATEDDDAKGRNVPLQHNGQNTATGNEDQHASKLHFFQDSGTNVEPSKKQELWKTASLDRNPQLNQAQVVKRSGSHDVVTSKQQSSPLKPQPPSPSRCVSGKRLCTGCSEPLGKGAAMIIDTLGLFFHIQCFKCGRCGGQLGDATAGTDVRIRNGLLSCHECYIASRGRGQPTTL
ncbi:LIM and calponin homology domains-containing protein 1-like isoform X2 [Archocentrus centrarchus]|uniref:LIM and calponin homology domains-containing protein 1-like isoform X2 n=1 Tax=Archocentrus centrarchus TaxID=63155 RepID=UPI0011EA358C|nr:LIM and calponin homology domains-containing protein 1-like isoform X2 [Archocentrus centrarchus]